MAAKATELPNILASNVGSLLIIESRAGARAFKIRGPNLKVGGQSIF